jgi:hypothetical protein
MAAAFRTLLRNPETNRSLLSRKLTYQLYRNEEARIHHWRSRGLEPPPRPLVRKTVAAPLRLL